MKKYKDLLAERTTNTSMNKVVYVEDEYEWGNHLLFTNKSGGKLRIYVSPSELKKISSGKEVKLNYSQVTLSDS
jgi:hypothetical protein